MTKDALKNALKGTGARVSGGNAPAAAILKADRKQGSRVGTKAITVHFPEEVRNTLKGLAGNHGRHVDDMVAEALNMLFVKYGKPEVAPRKTVV